MQVKKLGWQWVKSVRVIALNGYACVSILFFVILLSACTTNETAAPTSDSPQLVSEETLPPPTITPLQLVFSTPTEIAPGAPSFTPLQTTRTPSFFETATPPNTLTPTITDTATLTRTPTRTRTPTPSLTPTASITPTPTITFTPSRTFTVTPTIEGQVACPFAWFFTPAPLTCPLTSPLSTSAAYQAMERGFMVWLQSGLTIFVLFTDTSIPAWIVAPDTYTETEPEVDFNLQIPAGLLQPRRGFGKLWRNDRALQLRLGWATSAEIGYTAFLQTDSITGIQYLTGPNGEIYALTPDQTQWNLSN